MPKATNAELNRRINEVAKMLADGASRPEILEHASKKWNIGRASTDNLIRRANAIFEQESTFIRETEFGKALRRLNTLYAKAMKVQDFRVALAVQREIHNLLALPIPEKKILEHTGTITHEERVNRILGIFESAKVSGTRRATDD